MKIAVVGSGISGLSAAYYLSKQHQVDLFEKDDHFGGHSHTIDLTLGAKKVSVDIGFIVFNLKTYPNLINFFNENKIDIEKSDIQKQAMSLAKKMYQQTPVIYVANGFEGVAVRFRQQINENSKMLSYNVTIPEMNHNEIIGWENAKIDKKLFSMLWIHIGWPKNLDRMKITNEILSDKVSYAAHLTVPDNVPKNLTSLFFLINYIDWLSYWCGILNNVDIDAVNSIDLLKKRIA